MTSIIRRARRTLPGEEPRGWQQLVTPLGQRHTCLHSRPANERAVVIPVLKVCAAPGCSTLTTRSRCANHQAELDERDQRRRDQKPQRAIYRTDKWRKARRMILVEAQHTCALCGRYADTVDHIVPLAHGGDPYDLDNLRALCKSCHGRVDGGRSAEGSA